MLIKEKSFYKSFFSLMGMLVLQNVIMLSVNLADNIMIGGYSETSLAGVAAVNQLQFVFQQLTIACGDPLVVIAGQYWGQGRTEPIKNISRGAVGLGLALGLCLFVATSLFPYQIVGLFTTSPQIVEEGVKYLQIIRFTYVLFAVTNVLLAMLRSVETVKIAFYISLSSLVINCSINFLLINGNCGAPCLGVVGASVGTLTARVAELGILIFYLVFVDKRLKVKLHDFFVGEFVFIKDYLKLSVPFMVTGVIFGVSTALQTVVLGHMSDSAIAANSVATTLYQLLKVATVGAAGAASVHIGMAIGRGNFEEVKSMTKTMQLIFCGVGILTSVVLFGLRIPILNFYTLTPETRKLANSFILVLCVTCIGTAYQMPVNCGVVRGGGDAKFVLINDLISLWGIVLPFSFVAAFIWKWSPVAVVACLNSDQVFKCAAAAIKVNRYKWIKVLTRK